MKAYVTLNFILWYVLPLVLMVVMYSSISIVLWRTSSGRTSSDLFLRRRDTFTVGLPTATTAKDINTTDIDHRGSTNNQLQDFGGLQSTSPASSSPCPVPHYWGKPASIRAAVARTKLVLPNLGSAPRLNLSSPPRNDTIREAFDGGRCQSSGMHCLSTPTVRMRSASSPGDVLPRSLGQRKSSTELMLRKQAKRRNPLVARRKVIRLLIAIIVAFAVCVLPHHVRLLWQTWTTRLHYTHHNLIVPPVTFLLFYFNSCLNPFLYAFLSDNFRQSLRQLLNCRRW